MNHINFIYPYSIVRIESPTSNGWAYVRHCFSYNSIGCAIFTNWGIVFRGNKIHFDYVDHPNMSYIIDIRKEGEIKFAYFCKIKYQFSVKIKVTEGYILYNI